MMKKIVFFFFILYLFPSFSNFLFAQSESKEVKEIAQVSTLSEQEQKDSTEKSRLQEVDEMPKVLSQAIPVYPEEAIKKNLNGMVWLKVKVDESGAPASVDVERSTNPLFNDAALQAAKRYKFTPAMKSGRPVAVSVIIPFKFNLAPDEKKKTEGQQDCYYTDADEMPAIIGGLESFLKKIKYPAEAKKKGVEGKVLVKAFIDENGNVTATQILKNIGSDCGETAERLLKETKFTPAKLKGKTVKAEIVLPVLFKLK